MDDCSEHFYWHDALPYALLPLLSLSCYALPIVVSHYGFGWLRFLVRGPAILYHLVVQALALLGIALSWIWFIAQWSALPGDRKWTFWILLMLLVLIASTTVVVSNAQHHLFVMSGAPFKP